MEINLDKFADRVCNEQLFYEHTNNLITWDECYAFVKGNEDIVYSNTIDVEYGVKLLKLGYEAVIDKGD